MVGNSFPYSDRLISHHTKQISLPYPFLPPPHPCEKMSDWISRFHSHVHSDCHATFTISNFNLLIQAWVRIVGLRREKVGFEGLRVFLQKSLSNNRSSPNQTVFESCDLTNIIPHLFNFLSFSLVVCWEDT